MQPTTYYQRHKALILQKRRRTLLTTKGGKVIRGLNKRPHTTYCELCSINGPSPGRRTRLEYHHWIPDKPELGLWLCYPHHKLAELVEDSLFPWALYHYHALKATIERQFNARTVSRPPGAPK